jgi:hypothetical protein
MVLTAKTTTTMQQAKTPEEAYKVFAGAMAQGLGDVIADALGKALGAMSTAAVNPAIVGWEQYVKGMNMAVAFGTPGNNVPPTVLNTFSTSVIGAGAAPHIQGGSISIGGTWTF